jgi:ankyrin repeat protein
LTLYDLKDLRQTHVLNPLVTVLDYAPMTQMLIDHDASIDPKSGELGLTPLHVAVTMGHLTVERILLDHHADIDAANRLGLTALHMAALSGNVATAQLLLDRGADANAKVRVERGSSPYSRMIRRCRWRRAATIATLSKCF